MVRSHKLHDNLVEELVQKYLTQTNTVLNFNKKPIPDILIIDWETRQITGVEVEIASSYYQKRWNKTNKRKLQSYTNSTTKKPINKLIVISPTISSEYNLERGDSNCPT